MQHSDLDIDPGFLQAARAQLAKLKVKNTFIDVVDSDDDESLPPVGSVSSCPAGYSEFSVGDLHPGELPELPGPSSAPPAPQSPLALMRFQRAECPCLLTSPSLSPKGSIGTPNTAGGFQEAKDVFSMQDPALEEPVRRRGEKTETSQAASSSQATSSSQALKKKVWPPIEPLEIRRPVMSLGSQVHGTGNCKPCAWFWRPQGCSNGEECGHCHLCSAAELKARKKAKKSASQKLKAAEIAPAPVVAKPGPLQPP